jgi:hypothetical protein
MHLHFLLNVSLGVPLTGAVSFYESNKYAHLPQPATEASGCGKHMPIFDANGF